MLYRLIKFIRCWLYQNHHKPTALLCDDPYKPRVNELTENVDNYVLNSNLNENKLELQKLQNMNQKKGEGSDSVLVGKCESEKRASIKHIQEVKFQVKGTRDYLKQCQELLQEESEDLEFERNVKLQERGLGSPIRTNYRDYITQGGGVAGLVGGAGMSVFLRGQIIYLTNGHVKDILLTFLFAIILGGISSLVKVHDVIELCKACM